MVLPDARTYSEAYYYIHKFYSGVDATVSEALPGQGHGMLVSEDFLGDRVQSAHAYEECEDSDFPLIMPAHILYVP